MAEQISSGHISGGHISSGHIADAHDALEQSSGTHDHAATEHEKPEDWGWHHEFRLGRQVGGWFTVIVMLLYLTGWHYNRTGNLAIGLVVAALVGGLLWDRQRQRNQWRR